MVWVCTGICVFSQRTGEVPPPHMVVIPPGWYSPEHQNFNDPKHITKDKLLPKGYGFCRCEEYHLGKGVKNFKYVHVHVCIMQWQKLISIDIVHVHVTYTLCSRACWLYHLCLSIYVMCTECVLGEDRFYIVSPIDILLAQKRDVADHIDWLLQRKDFEVHACTYLDWNNLEYCYPWMVGMWACIFEIQPYTSCTCNSYITGARVEGNKCQASECTWYNYFTSCGHS